MHDSFLTPFTDEVLENVGGQEEYSFTDEFFGYHQIKIMPKDTSNTTFTTKWGCFQYSVTLFGLKNAHTIFSHVVVVAFKEVIHKFLKVYFDDWTIFGLVKCHVASLCLMLHTCRGYQITLNLKKCLFCIPFGNLLGDVVCRQGLMVDPMKIMVTLNLKAPRSVKQLHATLGHTGYYKKFNKSYAQITTPMKNCWRRMPRSTGTNTLRKYWIYWKKRWLLLGTRFLKEIFGA